MAKGNNQKLKLLQLARILTEETNDEHGLTVAEIIGRLKDHDITADRKTLYQGQTPQTFRAAAFRSIYKSLTEEEKAILTDAVKAFVIKGRTVVPVRGAATNIKVTYQSDIEYAETILEGMKQ